MKEEQAIPFKHEMYQLGVTLEKLARDAGVEIRLNTEVTPELVEKEAPDALIVAVGRRKNADVAQTFATLEQIWSEYGVYEQVEEEN